MRKLLLIILILSLTACTSTPPPLTLYAPTPDDLQENEELQNEEAPDDSSDNSGKKSLTVYSNDCFITTFLEIRSQDPAFAEYFSDFNITFDSFEKDDGASTWFLQKNLNTALLAGSDEFDIYFIDLQRRMGLDVLNEGYFYDLSQDEELNAQFDLMFDPIRASCTYDGKIFGIPAQHDTQFMVYNLEILDEMGISADDMKNYNDIISLNNAYKEHYNTEKNGVVLYEPFPYTEFIVQAKMKSMFDEKTFEFSEELLDLPSFKSLYDKSDEINKAGMGMDYTSIDSYILENDNLVGFHSNVGNFIYDTEKYAIRPLITKENPNDFLYMNRLTYLCINPYSKNIDEALELFNIYADTLKANYIQEDTALLEGKRYNAENNNPITLIFKDADTYINNPLGLDPPYGTTNQELLDSLGNVYNNSDYGRTFPDFYNIYNIMHFYFSDLQLEKNQKLIKERIEKISREYSLR